LHDLNERSVCIITPVLAVTFPLFSPMLFFPLSHFPFCPFSLPHIFFVLSLPRGCGEGSVTHYEHRATFFFSLLPFLILFFSRSSSCALFFIKQRTPFTIPKQRHASWHTSTLPLPFLFFCIPLFYSSHLSQIAHSTFISIEERTGIIASPGAAAR